MFQAIKLFIKSINPIFIVYFLLFLMGILVGGLTINYLSNNTIQELKREILLKDAQKSQQEKTFNEQLVNIENAAKVKEKENYERYQQKLKENQAIIDNLNTSNNGLRIKVRNLSSSKTQSSSMGDGTSSGSGFEAELDIANSRELVKISNRCDIYKEQLKALQDYINTYNSSIK